MLLGYKSCNTFTVHCVFSVYLLSAGGNRAEMGECKIAQSWEVKESLFKERIYELRSERQDEVLILNNRERHLHVVETENLKSREFQP